MSKSVAQDFVVQNVSSKKEGDYSSFAKKMMVKL